jgi:hypothetical protein
MASRDFLRVFGAGAGHQDDAAAAAGRTDDVELSLGLSLGGRFGTTDAKRPRLARSSSIASVCSVSSLHADADAAPLPLLRTTSLPTETEEERWRRRETQSRRRLEARQKRVERRNSMASLAPAVVGGTGRRSNASQGSNSASTTEQGMHQRIISCPSPHLLLFAQALSCSQLPWFSSRCCCLMGRVLVFKTLRHAMHLSAT